MRVTAVAPCILHFKSRLISHPIKNPGQLVPKLRRSRGSLCPWVDLHSVSTAVSSHGISDGAQKVASLG